MQRVLTPIVAAYLLVVLPSNPVWAESTVPHIANEVGVVGPNLIRLFGPGQIMVDGQSESLDGFFALSSDTINTLQSMPGKETGCLLGVSSAAFSELISVKSQTCDEIIRQVRQARRIGNDTLQ